MLKNISPLISPDLLKNLAQMGHGDEIILADAHFPANSLSSNVLRADGVSVTALLKAILPIFELDQYAPPVLMMQAAEGDTVNPALEESYLSEIIAYRPDINIQKLERFAFYKQAKTAFCIVITGETGKYGNIILKKGVQP
ncbi:L-fucose mutarotase [Gammaproteobacteria bacterium]|nr:L-fucose mutarotase [Gammaproteobacteria bacterium]